MGGDTVWEGVGGAGEASVCAGGGVGTGGAGGIDCTGDGVEEARTCIPPHGK